MSKKIEFLAIMYYKIAPEIKYGIVPIIAIAKHRPKGESISLGLLDMDTGAGYNICELNSYNGETALIRKY